MIRWLLIAASIVLLMFLIKGQAPVTAQPVQSSEILPTGFIGNPSQWKVYVINRDIDVDRLRNFNDSWNTSDMSKYGVQYERFSAIVPPEDLEKFKSLISPSAFQELIRTESRGTRVHDEALTRGAVGCYLSHLTIWQEAIAKGYKNVLIFEDDAVIHPQFCELMMQARVPSDWAIFKAGYFCINCRETEYNYVELKKDWCLHAYFINTENLPKYMKEMMPMQRQIDWQLYTVNAPLYGSMPMLSYQENDKFETTVQTELGQPQWFN
jgi:hypothetical protein